MKTKPYKTHCKYPADETKISFANKILKNIKKHQRLCNFFLLRWTTKRHTVPNVRKNYNNKLIGCISDQRAYTVEAIGRLHRHKWQTKQKTNVREWNAEMKLCWHIHTHTQARTHATTTNCIHKVRYVTMKTLTFVDFCDLVVRNDSLMTIRAHPKAQPIHLPKMLLSTVFNAN